MDPTIRAGKESRWFEDVGLVVDRIESAVSSSLELAVVTVLVHDVDRLCAAAGHSRAGKILEEFHSRLRELVRQGDMVVRLSDRKFVLLLYGLRNQGHVQLAAQKIQRLVRMPPDLVMGNQPLQVTMGVALVPGPHASADEVLRSAELALLDGRRHQRPITFYQVQAADQMINEWDLEAKFADALETGKLEFHYQPKLDLNSMRVVGAEALVRWYDPVLGQVPPDLFIEVAENSGSITALTDFSIQRSCSQLNHWQQFLNGITLAINVTPSLIKDMEIVDVLENATRIWGVAADAIVLEVTEDALMADPDTSHRILTEIRKFGAKVSIDDFGTGYSSLSYLKTIPADELKVDRSFVMNMLVDSGDYKIVEHTISIAQSFGLDVVAEGVPNDATMTELRALGCGYAQGNHICEPLAAEDFLSWCLSYAEKIG